jgi:hypothetical protein
MTTRLRAGAALAAVAGALAIAAPSAHAATTATPWQEGANAAVAGWTAGANAAIYGWEAGAAAIQSVLRSEQPAL